MFDICLNRCLSIPLSVLFSFLTPNCQNEENYASRKWAKPYKQNPYAEEGSRNTLNLPVLSAHFRIVAAVRQKVALLAGFYFSSFFSTLEPFSNNYSTPIIKIYRLEVSDGSTPIR